MSFIADLFGGNDTPAPTPAPLQATPTINGAASESAAREERSRLNQRFGVDKALLTPAGLGDSSYSPRNIQRTSVTGGGAIPTSGGYTS